MKAFSLKTWRIGIAAGLIAACLCGCTLLSGATRKDGVDVVHSVKWRGETLSIIAKWYTGSLENWKAVARANPSLRPDKIVIGDRIRIPAAIVKNREPMPKNYLAEFGTEKKVKSTLPDTGVAPEIQTIPAEPAPEIQTDTDTKRIVPKDAPTDAIQDKTALPEKMKQTGPDEKVSAPASLPQQPTPPTPLPQPASEKTAEQPQKGPSSEKEPDLFGPKGYSN